MAASTAPAVKKELLALLRADPGLTGVQIDYADPGAEIGQEEIFYGRTLQTEQPAPGMRGTGTKMQESYNIELYVYVAADGNDPEGVEERCWAVVAEIENVVQANNTNSGALSAALAPGSGWVVMAGIEMTPFAFNGQRVAEALCKVHVEARK